MVKNADMLEIVNASMVNSRLWKPFVQLKFFTVNLRLLKQFTAVSDDTETVTAAEVFNKEQREYLEMLDIIGDGRKLSGSTSDSVIDFTLRIFL